MISDELDDKIFKALFPCVVVLVILFFGFFANEYNNWSKRVLPYTITTPTNIYWSKTIKHKKDCIILDKGIELCGTFSIDKK